MNDKRLEFLFKKAINRSCTQEEYEELHALLADPANESQYRLYFEQLPTLTAADPAVFTAEDTAAMLHRILDKQPEKKVTRMKPYVLWAAASITFAAIVLGYRQYVLLQPPATTKSIAALTPATKRNAVVLTLSNGKQVTLDTLRNRHVIEDNGTTAVQSGNGTLSYQESPATGEIVYNTLSTPRGRQFKLELPDGTKVWLNAASSLQYPTAFGDTRQVTLTGEAYFEVAQQAQHPFEVIVNNEKITVLGTSFNVKAYNDEAYVKTTLLQGSILVKPQQQPPTLLKPGEQATLSNNQLHIRKVDTKEDVAWMSDLFYFSDTDISAVAHQLERWYDIEIDYASLPEARLYGQLPRSTPLPVLLRAIEKTSNIKFSLNNNRLSIAQ
ncbi:FecR family protein [Chitinophaga jiangningensis]|uniref:FecR family protein n=1 Tax=Chitinophaga jiangningensis TaxID=1419482 RepID=A0A1M7J1Q4_9BACT|nr:FecR domain-containing protein [Chitinophaga jiangningensis]SHM46865.1 FecR family protein [Chitinophaga jiangningensis]